MNIPNMQKIMIEFERESMTLEMKGEMMWDTVDDVMDDEEEEVREEMEGEGTGFDVQDEDEDDMHAAGVPAARGWRLDAR